MADADYVEWGIDMEEWEQGEMERPPPHLLADEEEKEGDEKKMRGNMKYHCCSKVHFNLRRSACPSEDGKNVARDNGEVLQMSGSLDVVNGVIHTNESLVKLNS
ncbi:hypothetical protein SLEP1_g33160 [Rubroshorea leprosula]|uniref:Uncharacterized protein n=1 Tax=Rubroshorea leprosula TaxID=152421 RepID=A0AAV5KFU5_9ROSI|nr:hypothetical protein SLEP1_g33160 [Rubroshorea leprosula]